MWAKLWFLVIALLYRPDIAQAHQPLIDEAIRQQLITLSRQAYSGSCPCPYSVNRGGRRCGKSSAYSRPGGARPLCYPQDVSAEMVDKYRKSQL